ncbi:sensor histidine kinase [Gracilibacillus alcaliphilus]|uniref:sensor histidine kinase n=1 Tax=Gracilibacillus alcaliphilus TaxID=1401441 RepID=UPI001957C6FE|nr:sensor histidine kinase [Gracilibacillus alcaliphilus]MBM7679104.1 two-component system sensor histidine kinase YesM [Gracilibacillus alcaliphilus]
MNRKFFIKPRIKRLRTRFWVAMISLAIPSMIVLGAISYLISKQTIVDNHVQNYEDLLRISSEMSELTYENVINLHRLILSNEEIRNELLLASNESAEYYKTAIILHDILSKYYLNTKYIESVCLFDIEDNSYCYGISRRGTYFFNNVQEIKTKNWYKQAKLAEGKEIFLGYNILNGSNDSFSSVKFLRNPNNLYQDELGVLVINLNKEMFDAISVNYRDNTFMIVDSSDDGATSPIYVNNQHDGLTSIDWKDGEGIDMESFQNNGYVSSYYTNPTTGWSYIHLIKQSHLLKDSNKIGLITFTIVGIMGTTAVLVSIYLSGSILYPLLKLKKMVANTGNPASNFEEVFDDDEVGKIGNQINVLVKNNLDLRENLMESRLKEKESELRALQAQIKPHFLYNTLSTIYWMARKNNENDIAKISISLSESFKLSLNKGKEFLRVQEELEHIQHYCSIQSIRYGKRFEYIECVQPELKDKLILKLVLQPFVENSYYHGLETKVGEGYVKLTGYLENNCMIFVIKDNGVGVEDINFLNSGYGIKNVRERLDLLYGEKSSVEVKSERNVGTTVKLRIPLKLEVD